MKGLTARDSGEPLAALISRHRLARQLAGNLASIGSPTDTVIDR
jgi:hypothetical protein